MSDVVYSHVGVTVAICTTPQNDNLDRSGFEALTYVNIANIGMIGEYGITTNLIGYDGLDTSVQLRSKGVSDGGTPEIEVARVDGDPGQDAMVAAGAAQVFDNYALKITKQDGAVDYWRGLVSGPTSPGGANEDFDLHVYNVALNQVIEHVDFAAPPLVWIFDTGFLAGDGIVTSGDTIPA